MQTNIDKTLKPKMNHRAIPRTHPGETHATKRRLIYAETAVGALGNSSARTYAQAKNMNRSSGTTARADWPNTKYMGGFKFPKNPADNNV